MRHVIANAGLDRALDHAIQPNRSVRLLPDCLWRGGINPISMLRVTSLLLRLGEDHLLVVLPGLLPPFTIALVIVCGVIVRLVILPVTTVGVIVQLVLVRLVIALVIVLLVIVRMVVVPHGASAR